MAVLRVMPRDRQARAGPSCFRSWYVCLLAAAWTKGKDPVGLREWVRLSFSPSFCHVFLRPGHGMPALMSAFMSLLFPRIRLSSRFGPRQPPSRWDSLNVLRQFSNPPRSKLVIAQNSTWNMERNCVHVLDDRFEAQFRIVRVCRTCKPSKLLQDHVPWG